MIRSARRSDLPAIAALSMELYLQYTDPDFPVTTQSLLKMLDGFLTQLPYFRVMVHDGEVVGWLAAGGGSHQMHSYVQALSQLYYHTRLRGIASVKALIEFHENLHSFAEAKGYDIVVTSSYLPNHAVFERVLLGAGWQLHAGRLTKRTQSYPQTHEGRGFGARGGRRPRGAATGTGEPPSV